MKRSHLLLLTFTLAISFCSNPARYKDYNYLLQPYNKNTAEIALLIRYYQSQKDAEKIRAIEYLFDRLPDQYFIKYYLSGNQANDTVWLTTPMPPDLISAKIQEGYHLRGDTIFDISHIKAQVLIKHIDVSFGQWKKEYWNKDLSFQQFCSTILPYRVRNEQLDSFTTVFPQRFSIKEMVREETNIQNDLIHIVRSYFAGNRTNSSEVDFFSAPSFLSVLNGNDPVKEVEDENTGQVLLLRSFGVPMTSHYTPYFARSISCGYGSLSLVPDSLYHNPKIREINYKRGVPKIYRPCFEKEKWDNPYDNLVKMGIAARNIPLCLFISRMEDITAERTISRDITVHVPDSVLHERSVFICCYMKDEWKILYWGTVNREQKSATFNNMGTGLLYLLATYKDGCTKTFGSPFTIDSTGLLTQAGSNSGSWQDLIIKETNFSKNPTPLKKYHLYGWNIQKQSWTRIGDTISDEDGKLSFKHVYTNGLYKILSQNDEDSPVRIFTIKDQIQQWW